MWLFLVLPFLVTWLSNSASLNLPSPSFLCLPRTRLHHVNNLTPDQPITVVVDPQFRSAPLLSAVLHSSISKQAVPCARFSTACAVLTRRRLFSTRDHSPRNFSYSPLLPARPGAPKPPLHHPTQRFYHRHSFPTIAISAQNVVYRLARRFGASCPCSRRQCGLFHCKQWYVVLPPQVPPWLHWRPALGTPWYRGIALTGHSQTTSSRPLHHLLMTP